jgi:hypothetical protein
MNRNLREFSKIFKKQRKFGRFITVCSFAGKQEKLEVNEIKFLLILFKNLNYIFFNEIKFLNKINKNLTVIFNEFKFLLILFKNLTAIFNEFKFLLILFKNLNDNFQ